LQVISVIAKNFPTFENNKQPMSNFDRWIDILESSINDAIDRFLSKYENKSKTYKSHKSSFDKYAQTHTANEVKSKFANNLLVLTAAVMKADGKVMKSELAFVKSFFLEQFPKNFAKVRIQMLKGVLKENYSAEKAAKNMLECMPLNQRKYLLEYLFNLAKSDGNIVRLELKIIDSIAKAMRYSGAGYQKLKARYVKIASKDVYSILGIKKDVTDKEVKKAYRKLAVKNHPDKFAQASKEERLQAKKRFQKIQGAYETIKKARGM